MEWTTVERVRALNPEQAKELVGQPVEPAEPNITRPTVVTDGGEPVLAYLPVPNAAELRRAVLSVRYAETARGPGMRGASRTFGWSPRVPAYGREACQSSSLTGEHPAVDAVLTRWAVNLADMLREFAPGVADNDKGVVGQVERDWRLTEDSLWTSGVINRSSRLPYHRDTFNFPTWSAMPVLRRGMRGGYLSVPEYDLTIECRDGYAVFFPGHELLHGVTPMEATRPDGYRYSVVYYALKGMKDCFTAALETERAARVRTDRERAAARDIANGTTKASPLVLRSKRIRALRDGDDIDPHEEIRP